MAHIVGVPKRDPCQKCSLPVFLAERLMIGKNVYHRTCLRCARCDSQLSPGSFYETEIDGEYCCETCPDEEKKLDVATSSKESNKTETLVSKSIADRLAFFENDGSKVLQKSLSDEEKSQSLKKFTETQVPSVYKPNAALNSFMNSHLSDVVDSVSHTSSRRSSNSSSSSTSNTTEDDVSEEPPELPKSLPPSSLEVDISGIPSLQPSEASLESSTVDSNVNVDLKSQDVHISSAKIENTENIPREPSVEHFEEHEDTSSTSRLNDLTLSVNVTKDSSEDDEQMRTIIDPTSVERCKETDNKSSQSTNNSSMVRARLHQFEVIANKSQESSISSLSKNRLSDHRTKANRTFIVEGSLQSLEETEVPKIVPESKQEDSQDGSTEIISSTIDSVANSEKEDASYTVIEDKHQKTVAGNDGQEGSHVHTTEPSTFRFDKKSSEEIVQSQLSVDKESPSALHSSDVKISSDSSLVEKSPAQDSEPQNEVVREIESPKEEKMVVQDTTVRKESLNLVEKRDEYPEELNPFKSDDEGDQSLKAPISFKEKRKSLNPFESSDEECENEKKIKPPRPPPPKKISTNPFGSESEDEELSLANSVSNSFGTPRRTPVPTPRNYKSASENVTPEPTPRVTRQSYDTPLKNTSDYYGSTSSLSGAGSAVKINLDQFHRESEVRGSGRSLASSGSASGVIKPRRKKAPAPPPPNVAKVSKELFSPTDQESKKSSPGSSTATTPIPQRKKRPAPAPPSAPKDNSSLLSMEPIIKTPIAAQDDKKEDNAPAQIEKLCDEEKALLEGNSKTTSNDSQSTTTLGEGDDSNTTGKRRLIALDASLVEDANSSEDLKAKEPDNVVYRRTLAPPVLDDSLLSPTSDPAESHDRQLEKMKDNKEAKNRNRQSQISLPSEENDPLYNKSVHGKWKRRKGPAPALPIPPKKVLQMLPLQEIRHELEIIEVQQQGLEKQGVMLEKMIRERCEGPTSGDSTDGSNSNPPNSKEVEDLILQLFELVNEKNELFRRQAELMYLRRQHRLEQEQADLEYEIRVLMAQPERNKTDSDKAREEALIARLVEVVQLRNEVVECLEMDRLREAEEDLSIKQRLEMHSAKRDEELSKQTPTKLSKKEKKKQKEHKKIGKSKKLDADKDADESELSAEKQKPKKKKKKFLF